jgi:putative membrane protein
MPETSWSRSFRVYAGLVGFSAAGTALQRATGLDPGWIAPITALLTLGLGVACVLRAMAPSWPAAAILMIGAASEICGLYTGWPFGNYRYTGAWFPSIGLPGGHIFPLPLPFAWLMMAAGAYLACLALGMGRRAILFGPLLATLADIMMEPAAVGPLRYWVWLGGDAIPGWIGSAPLMNSIGWLLTSLLASGLLWSCGVRKCGSREPLAVLILHVALMVWIFLVAPMPSP